MAYDIGDTIRTAATFTVNGVNTDPTTVEVTIRSPSGTSTTYTWAAGQVTKTSTGNFQYDFIVTEAGRWFARWVGTGAAAASSEQTFDVIPSGVLGGQALDVLTLAEGKAAVNLREVDTSQDSEVAQYITTASLALDGLVGPVVIRSIVGETHDGGASSIELKYRPVSAITSITEYAGIVGTALIAEAIGVATTSTNFALDARWGVIYRRSNGADARFPGGRSRVVVSYEAGRFASTAAVDARYKTAAGIILSHIWRREQSGEGYSAYQRSYGLAIPKAAKDLMNDQLLPAVTVA